MKVYTSVSNEPSPAAALCLLGIIRIHRLPGHLHLFGSRKLLGPDALLSGHIHGCRHASRLKIISVTDRHTVCSGQLHILTGDIADLTVHLHIRIGTDDGHFQIILRVNILFCGSSHNLAFLHAGELPVVDVSCRQGSNDFPLIEFNSIKCGIILRCLVLHLKLRHTVFHLKALHLDCIFTMLRGVIFHLCIHIGLQFRLIVVGLIERLHIQRRYHAFLSHVHDTFLSLQRGTASGEKSRTQQYTADRAH